MRVGKTGRKNVKAVDLVGTTYKGFSVLDCKRENNRTYLFVRCPVCKKEKWMRKTTLDQDKTVSCGCIRDKHQFKQVDIKGQKFGHLTALEPTSKNRSKQFYNLVMPVRLRKSKGSQYKRPFERRRQKLRLFAFPAIRRKRQKSCTRNKGILCKWH